MTTMGRDLSSSQIALPIHQHLFIICSSYQILHTNFALFLPLFLGVIGMTEATDAKHRVSMFRKPLNPVTGYLVFSKWY